jgi:2-amino-4-hydroxy-6-hydroxymethyldihydropteridine diphosphokinase
MVDDGGVFIGLGSNLEDRDAHITAALRELAATGEIRVIACSSLYETEPVGGPASQPLFLNAVAELATDLSPDALLARLQAVEQAHGRVRTVPNGPRTLDLDLLLYRDQVIDTPDLHVPHPRMWQRPFVMQPLAEICDLGRLVAARRLRSAPARAEIAADVHRYADRPEAVA